MLPTAPAGWTFGTPAISGSPATIVKGDQAAAVERDGDQQHQPRPGLSEDQQGVRPEDLGFAGTFAIVYNCGAGDQTVNLAAGGSTTVGPFATGTSCTVSEPLLPTAPAGWTFGTPIVTGSPAIIGKDTTVEATVTNSISRDQGYLKISKAFDPQTSGFAGTFAIVYNCGAGDQTVNLAAGESDDGRTVRHRHLVHGERAAAADCSDGLDVWHTVVSGSPATIVKGDQAAAVSVTVTNTISRDQGYLRIGKVFDPQTSGFSGTFDYRLQLRRRRPDGQPGGGWLDNGWPDPHRHLVHGERANAAGCPRWLGLQYACRHRQPCRYRRR